MTESRVSKRIEEDEEGPAKATKKGELLREGSWGGVQKYSLKQHCSCTIDACNYRAVFMEKKLTLINVHIDTFVKVSKFN